MDQHPKAWSVGQYRGPFSHTKCGTKEFRLDDVTECLEGDHRRVVVIVCPTCELPLFSVDFENLQYLELVPNH